MLDSTKKKGVWKILGEFPNKNWKSSPSKDLLKKIDKTGDEQRNPGSGRPRTVRMTDNYSRRPYSELG